MIEELSSRLEEAANLITNTRDRLQDEKMHTQKLEADIDEQSLKYQDETETMRNELENEKFKVIDHISQLELAHCERLTSK